MFIVLAATMVDTNHERRNWIPYVNNQETIILIRVNVTP